LYIDRVTAVMKVVTDIIAILANPILVITHVKIFKTDVIVVISNVIQSWRYCCYQ
jgi:hypothetical protein